MVQQNCQEGTTNFREPTRRREQPVGSEDLSGELQGESGESQPAEPTDDAEARADFWAILGDFIYRHHIGPRVQLYVPKEETFPIPPKYVFVTRLTHTDLDVLQEKRIDDYWNVDSNRHLSESWKGFTKFTLLKEKPPKGFLWSGERLTKVQATTRPENVRPEVWTKIGKAAQNRERQEWAKEKPKLDNARRLRGISFTDPDDEEVRVKDKQASRKRMQSPNLAMKMSPKQCMVVYWNLMNPRGNERNLCDPKFTKIFDDTLQFGAQVYSDATSDENSECNSCRGQRIENARDHSSMVFGRIKSKKGGYSGSTKRDKNGTSTLLH